MKRVSPTTDIMFPLSGLKGLTTNFKIRFYTTNKSFYIEKTQRDVSHHIISSPPNFVTEDFINLNWSELQSIGDGVMNFTLYTYETDEGFDDGKYDNSYSRTTDYYIDSGIIIDDDQPDKTVSELIAEIDQKVDGEIARSTQKDEEHDEAIANLQDEIDNIDVDLSDYYTKEEIDAMELVTSAALNDLNSRINAIDLTGYATETWVSTNYYDKTYINTTIGNIETLLSQI